MILICLAINPVGDCSEMTVLGFRSSLLVYKPSTKNNKNAVKSDVKTGRI